LVVTGLERKSGSVEGSIMMMRESIGRLRPQMVGDVRGPLVPSRRVGLVYGLKISAFPTWKICPFVPMVGQTFHSLCPLGFR
jgi:hypothetical protein